MDRVALRVACSALVVTTISVPARAADVPRPALVDSDRQTGWRLLATGGVEFLIQLEAAHAAALRSGDQLVFDVPADLGGVRSFRIVIGNWRLPREGAGLANVAVLPGPLLAAATSDPPAADEQPPSPVRRGDEPPEDATIVGAAAGDAAVGDTALGDAAAGETAAGDTGVGDTAAAVPDAVVDPYAAAAPPTATAPREPDDVAPSLFEPAAERPLPHVADVAAVGDVTSHRPPGSVDAPGDEQSGAAGPSDLRPWWPLTAALMALFASLGGNLFLGWIGWDARRRYRSLLGTLRESQHRAITAAQ